MAPTDAVPTQPTYPTTEVRRAGSCPPSVIRPPPPPLLPPAPGRRAVAERPRPPSTHASTSSKSWLV